MPRAILCILDSFGIGGAPDASDYGDAGANTLGHIAERYDLRVPNLDALGLGAAAAGSASAGKSRRARTRRPGIGKSQGYPCRSSGVISPRPFQPSPIT